MNIFHMRVALNCSSTMLTLLVTEYVLQTTIPSSPKFCIRSAHLSRRDVKWTQSLQTSPIAFGVVVLISSLSSPLLPLSLHLPASDGPSLVTSSIPPAVSAHTVMCMCTCMRACVCVGSHDSTWALRWKINAKKSTWSDLSSGSLLRLSWVNMTNVKWMESWNERIKCIKKMF